MCPAAWDNTHQARFWQLLHWLDQPSPSVPRKRPELEEVLIAYQVGEATEADLLDQLLGCQPCQRYSSFQDLRRVTGRKLHPDLAKYVVIQELGDRCRQRIIEIELTRGDLPTAASQPALALRSVEGINTLVRLMQALGKEKLVRGYTYDNQSKATILSHLIRVAFPSESDTPETFAQQVKAAIPQKRLIQLAFYAPQWSNYVETALGWSSFAEAVWWIHAHTKDNNWQVDKEIRETWTAQVSERTPLSGQSLVDGAVDVSWFVRIYKALGKEKWQQLDEAAQYASGGGGHKRAQLFADAMLGRIEKAALVSRITSKRHQDSIRALGLLPIAKGKKRDRDLLERYQIIQEFRRTSRQYGSQRQASEKLASAIAMENLARTAGYPDPQRLEWAMEAEAIADLVASPLTVAIDEVSVSLAITEKGPELTATKKGKPLKSIPAKVKKDPKVVEMVARKQDITRQASRMRLSLEEAMCRGDTFTTEELRQLCTHPVLAPMLEQLIFVGEEAIGYPVEQGQLLQFHDGSISPIRGSCLRVAHPCDLLATQSWHLWQQECFWSERSQPFKQVFRELYVLIQTEKAEGTRLVGY